MWRKSEITWNEMNLSFDVSISYHYNVIDDCRSKFQIEFTFTICIESLNESWDKTEEKRN